MPSAGGDGVRVLVHPGVFVTDGETRFPYATRPGQSEGPNIVAPKEIPARGEVMIPVNQWRSHQRERRSGRRTAPGQGTE